MERFREQLSFNRLYFNQFQVKKLEGLMNEAHKKSIDEMHKWVQELQDFDNTLAKNSS